MECRLDLQLKKASALAGSPKLSNLVIPYKIVNVRLTIMMILIIES